MSDSRLFSKPESKKNESFIQDIELIDAEYKKIMDACQKMKDACQAILDGPEDLPQKTDLLSNQFDDKIGHLLNCGEVLYWSMIYKYFTAQELASKKINNITESFPIIRSEMTGFFVKHSHSALRKVQYFAIFQIDSLNELENCIRESRANKLSNIVIEHKINTQSKCHIL